jgi:hypothetical protein
MADGDPGGDTAVEPKPEPITTLPTGLKLIVTAEQVADLWAVQDLAARRKALAAQVGIADADHNFQNEVILDFHYCNLAHCQSLCLPALQTAVFISLMSEVLFSMKRPSPTSSTQGEPYTCPDCFREYQRLCLQHAVDKPPSSVAYFVSSQVRLLTDFVNLTLMKHFHLYQYCLLHAREVDTVRVDVTLEEPSAPPDLNQAKLREEPTDHGLAGWSHAPPTGPDSAAEGWRATTGERVDEGEDDLLDNLVDRNLKAEVRELIERKMDQLSEELQERLEKRERDMQATIAEAQVK